MQWEGYFTFVEVFKKNPQPQFNNGKTSDNSKLRSILQSAWPIYFKIFHVETNEERLRNCQRREETQETWWLNKCDTKNENADRTGKDL